MYGGTGVQDGLFFMMLEEFFPDVRALDGLSFVIHKNETYCFAWAEWYQKDNDFDVIATVVPLTSGFERG